MDEGGVDEAEEYGGGDEGGDEKNGLGDGFETAFGEVFFF